MSRHHVKFKLSNLLNDTFSRIVRYFGAGVYEELLFRLMLLPLAMAAIGLAIASRRIKLAAALLLTSFLFATAHYLGPYGDTFEIASFSFRALAGVFFAVAVYFSGLWHRCRYARALRHACGFSSILTLDFLP